MRIFDLRTGTATVDDHPPSRRLRSRISQQKADSLDFLTSRHGEFGGSLSTKQLQRFIEECWGEMQALGLTWKPSVSTLRRALTLLHREARYPRQQGMLFQPRIMSRLASFR
ncbi:MAG: hypothetical protein AB7I79_23280 [Rhizobiaceae bacterium]